MNFTIKKTTNPEDPANSIVSAILRQLELGKRVLFFLTGGSSIAVGVKITELLYHQPKQDLIKNLTITLTDERYGATGHTDSNWQQLIEKGLNLPGALFIPILIGESRDKTVENFNKTLLQEFNKTDKENTYKIGLFGIGADGHTAGILPGSGAVKSENLAFGYDTPTFSRITITPEAIEKLDEAIAWVRGENKWGVIKDLQEKDMDVTQQPAQILKKVPVLTIFTDYKF